MVRDIEEEAVKHYTVKIPKELLERFKLQARMEGYSVMEAFNLLVKYYVEGKLNL